MVSTSWLGPLSKAELILAEPLVPAIGTYRSRGIDSSRAEWVAGMTWTRMRTSARWPATFPDWLPSSSPWRVSEPTIGRLKGLAGGGAPAGALLGLADRRADVVRKWGHPGFVTPWLAHGVARHTAPRRIVLPSPCSAHSGTGRPDVRACPAYKQ